MTQRHTRSVDAVDADVAEVLSELAFVVDELDAEQLAEQRRSRRFNQLLERESSTFTGVLVNLAEQRTRVVIAIEGWECRGFVAAVGADVVVVLGDDGQRSVIRMASVCSVTPESRSSHAAAVSGDRLAPLDATFEDLLRDLQALEVPVTVLCETGATKSGRFHWIGIDVAYLGPVPMSGVTGSATYGSATYGSGTYIALSAIRVAITR
jgi:hypothetical protein